MTQYYDAIFYAAAAITFLYALALEAFLILVLCDKCTESAKGTRWEPFVAWVNRPRFEAK